MSIFGGIGAGLGAIGSIVGAGATNRAGRQARDQQASWGQQQQDRLLGLLFGNQGIHAGAQGDPKWDHIGYGYQGQGGDQSGAAAAGLAGYSGGLFGGMRGLESMAQNRGQRNLNLFNQEAQGIGNLAGGAEDIARQYGSGANAVIDADAARSLKAANALSQGRLNASGLGTSTLVGNQLGQNTIASGRESARLKNEVQKDMTDRLLNARQNNVATQMGLEGTRTNLRGSNLAMNLGTRQNNMNSLLSLFQSGNMNPFAGQSASQYYPGVSALGSGLATAGTALGAVGGQIAGANQADAARTQQNEQFQQMLAALRRGNG